MKARLIIDIETAGQPFDTLDAKQQEKLKVSLYPYTAEIVCIGLLDPDTKQGGVYVQAPEGTAEWISEDGNLRFVPGTEIRILERFWQKAAEYKQVITFNGRGFDAPFLHIRSAMLGIKATKNLMPPRFDSREHYDLLEQLSFFGSFRKFSLDFICLGFGITSPKRQGVNGLDVAEMHRSGRYREIAEYNARDLEATRDLWERWTQHRGDR